MTGQLYKVNVQSTTLQGDMYKSVIILAANNQKDVERSVRYFYEVQRQEKHYISKIEKIKDKFYQISCHEVKDSPDMVQKLKENSINRHTPTNQNKNKNCVSIGIAGVCVANNENVAMKKIAGYLLSKSRYLNSKNPLLNDGLFIFETLGEIDPTRSARVESIYKNIQLFSGGAPSLGK